MRADEPVEASVGAVVDFRYNLRREIARGGMGVVFAAEHMRTGASVALKSLTRLALGQPEARQRIMREARALGRLRHAYIVSVLDAGVCDRFGPYLTLELVDGRPLSGVLLARGMLDAAATVALIRQLGEALDWAHAQDVVHRDVKPSNILVSKEPGRPEDVVRLIDFGVASVEGEGRRAKLTSHGDMIGTVEYMAPEQLMADGAVDHRADVYAAGVVLYECLVGEVPFPGSVPRVITSILSGDRPKAPSERVPGLGTAFDAITEKAMAQDPEDRYRSASALAEACRDAFGRPCRLALFDRGPEARSEIPVDDVELLEVVSDCPPSPESRSAQAQRRFARATYVTPVRILRKNEPPYDGRTEDISEGGMLVIGSAPIEQAEEVNVRFSLPVSGSLVTVAAVARWARWAKDSRAVGVQFSDLPDPARKEIRRYVELMGTG